MAPIKRSKKSTCSPYLKKICKKVVRRRMTVGGNRSNSLLRDRIAGVLREARALGIDRGVTLAFLAVKCGYENSRSETYKTGFDALVRTSTAGGERVERTGEYARILLPGPSSFAAGSATTINLPKTNAEALERLKRFFVDSKAAEVIGHLSNGPPLSRADLAEKMGYKNARSEGFAGPFQLLSTHGVVMVAASKAEGGGGVGGSAAAGESQQKYRLFDGASPCPDGGRRERVETAAAPAGTSVAVAAEDEEEERSSGGDLLEIDEIAAV